MATHGYVDDCLLGEKKEAGTSVGAVRCGMIGFVAHGHAPVASPM